MEQRLIDATEFDTKLFNDGLFGGLACAVGNTPRKRKFTIGEFRGMLAKAPTVDAVPVVRCGECVFATPFPSDAKPIICGNGQACRKNTTDFCSYGEPRTQPAE